MRDTTRSQATVAVAAVLGVVVVLVLVTWAASIGPSGVLTGDGPAALRSTPSPTTEPASPVSPGDVERIRARQDDREAPGWVTAIALLLELLVAAVAVYLLYRGGRWAWDTWDARRRPPPRPADVAFDVLEAPARLAAELRVDAEEQRRLLQEGTPRNGIVECWHRFERQAAGLGFEREPWETSSEFTLRMLELVSADPHAVTVLNELYREARFSEHPLSERHRQRAREALDHVHAGLSGIGGRR